MYFSTVWVLKTTINILFKRLSYFTPLNVQKHRTINANSFDPNQIKISTKTLKKQNDRRFNQQTFVFLIQPTSNYIHLDFISSPACPGPASRIQNQIRSTKKSGTVPFLSLSRDGNERPSHCSICSWQGPLPRPRDRFSGGISTPREPLFKGKR